MVNNFIVDLYSLTLLILRLILHALEYSEYTRSHRFL